MIIQPEWGIWNVNKYFYESEARRIAVLARYLAAFGSRISRQMDVQARPLGSLPTEMKSLEMWN